MSTTNRVSAAFDCIDVLENEDQGTVTFVADHTEEGTTPPTEWITVSAEATVDLEQYR